MINEPIHMNGLDSYLLCPIQYHLYGVHTSEAPKLLDESPSVTTHAIKLADHFSTTHPLIIPLQLTSVTSYFDVHYPSEAEY